LEWCGATDNLCERHADYCFHPGDGRSFSRHGASNGIEFSWSIQFFTLYSFLPGDGAPNSLPYFDCAKFRRGGQSIVDTDFAGQQHSPLQRRPMGEPEQRDDDTSNDLCSCRCRDGYVVGKPNRANRDGSRRQFADLGRQRSNSEFIRVQHCPLRAHASHDLSGTRSVHDYAAFDHQCLGFHDFFALDSLVRSFGGHSHFDRHEFREWFSGRLDRPGDAIFAGDNIFIGDDICQLDTTHCHPSGF
jgi:hypothetical protein